MEMAVDERLDLFSEKGHPCADQGEAEQAGHRHVESEGEGPEVEHPCGQAQRLEREGDERAEKDRPMLVFLEVMGNPLKGAGRDKMGDDVRSDQVPEEMAEEVAYESAQYGGAGGDRDILGDPLPVLQAEEHEDGVERDEEDEFEAE